MKFLTDVLGCGHIRSAGVKRRTQNAERTVCLQVSFTHVCLRLAFICWPGSYVPSLQKKLTASKEE